MTRVLIDDPDLPKHLTAARTRVEVCDGSGLVLGHFVPLVVAVESSDAAAKPPHRTGDASDDEFWKSVGIE